MNRIEYYHKTKSGRIYPIEVGWTTIPSIKIPVDKKLTENACQLGCRLYARNGGCPPFSPNFDSFQKEFSLITIIYGKLQIVDYPDKVLAGNYYIKWSFVEALLTPFTNRFAEIAIGKEGRKFLSSGFCKGCGRKRCAKKEGKECRQPSKRTFSLESTGVIVSDVTKSFLGFNLFWWDKNKLDYLPPYMVKIVGISSNHEIDNSEILGVLNR
jgi:predicted metal-binding protein